MQDTSRRGRIGTAAGWPILGVLVLATFMLIWIRRQNGPVPTSGGAHPAVGARVRTLSLQPLTGNQLPVTLESLGGQAALINYWGEWCGPCKYEFPHLVQLRRELEPQGLVFLSVSCGAGDREDPTALRQLTGEFLQDNNWQDFSTYYDPGYASRLSLMDAAKLDSFAYPTTVLVDRQGAIAGLWIGYWMGAEQDMQQTASRLLTQTQKSPARSASE